MDVIVFARDSRKALAWLAVAALAVTLVIAVQQRHRTSAKLADPRGGHISDFDRWMLMTPRFLHDHADYVGDELPTPPLSLIVFAPLTALSRPDAAFAWVCVKLPLACLVFWLCAAIAARAGRPLTAVALALIVAGWWLAVIVDMQEGQTNFLALAPLAAGLYVAQNERRGSDLSRRRADRSRRRDEGDAGDLHRLLSVEAALAACRRGGRQHPRLAARGAGAGVRLGPELAMARAVDADHDRPLRHSRHRRVRDEPVGRQLRAAAADADGRVRRASRRRRSSATT